MCDVLYGQAAVAQSVERPTAKQNIVGSSPSQGKKFQGKNVKLHHYYVRMSYTCIYRLLKCVMFRHPSKPE